MTEIISFYSVAASQGKRTLSLALAELLAEQHHRVLYVELDYKNSAVATATRISHASRNANEYFNQTVLNRNFDLAPFILKKEHLLQNEDRQARKLFEPLPKGLDYLIFPLKYSEKSFPTILVNKDTAEKDAQLYIEQFIYALKNISYEIVILNVPPHLSNLFGYEVLVQSDSIIDVITPSSTRLNEHRNTLRFISMLSPQIQEKWLTVLNMVSEEVDPGANQDLFGDAKVIQIPFDSSRQKEELAMRLSSSYLREKMESVAIQLEIAITPTVPKRRLFAKGV